MDLLAWWLCWMTLPFSLLHHLSETAKARAAYAPGFLVCFMFLALVAWDAFCRSSGNR
jgi:hypothetical protein